MTAPSAEWAWLARIRRPQGRRGEVFADLLTDFPEKFSERKHLWLIPPQSAEIAPRGSGLDSGGESPASAPREVELSAHWLHKGGIVLHFAGVDSISAAEVLKDIVVAVPRAQRAPLGEGEIYISDLAGCILVDVAGPSPLNVGIIEDVDRSAGPVALLIVLRDAKEILIPFARDYLRKIDLESRRVDMALPAGLIDLND